MQAKHRTKNPFFTVVTATLNIDNYLNDAIKSAKEQTYQNFEHIFVDGYSTDNTLSIIDNYKSHNPNVKLIQSSAKGISNAFNIGIKNAKGKYIIFLNGDDYFASKDSLEIAYNILNKNPNIDYLQGEALFNVNNNFIHYGAKLNKFFYFFNLSYGCPVPHVSTIMSKELLEKYHGFDESLKYQMDTDLFHKINGRVSIYFTNTAFSVFRFRKDSTTLKNYFDRFRYWKLFYERYKSILLFSGIIGSLKYAKYLRYITI